MDGEHLIVTCTLSNCEEKIRTHALIDTGATGFSFIDENFASHHHLPLLPLKNPRKLEVIDGRPIASGVITHITKVRLNINQHAEEIPMFVTKLGHYPIVLGIPWLRLHDPAIRFASNTVVLDSAYCLHHCLDAPVIIQGISSPPPEKQTPPPAPAPAGPPLHAALLGSTAFQSLVRNKRKRHGTLQVFSLSLYEINKALDHKRIEEGDLKSLVPEEYHEFLPLFSEAVARQLPPHRPYDHKIPLKEGFAPPFGLLYPMSRGKLKELKR